MIFLVTVLIYKTLATISLDTRFLIYFLVFLLLLKIIEF